MYKRHFGRNYAYRQLRLYFLFGLILLITLGGCGNAGGGVTTDSNISGEGVSDAEDGMGEDNGTTKSSSEKEHGKISMSKDGKIIYVHGWVYVYELSDNRTKKAKKIVFCRDAGLIVDWDDEINYVSRLHSAPLVEELEVEDGNVFLYEKDGMLVQRAGVGFDEDSTTEKETLMLCVPRRKGDVRIPEGVQYIIDGAFIGCSGVTSVVLPSSVEVVAAAAFGDMKSCTSIQVDENNDVYYEKNGVLYSQYSEPPGGRVVSYPAGKTDLVYNAAPKETRQIAAGAFLGANYLQEVYLPSRVRVIQRGAFQRCKKLEKVIVKNKKRISVEGDAFNDCPKLKEHVKDKDDL